MENKVSKKSFGHLRQVQSSELTGEPPEFALAYQHYLLLFGSKVSEKGECAIFDMKSGLVTNAFIGIFLQGTIKFSVCHWKDNIFLFYSIRHFGVPQLFLLYFRENGSKITFEKEELPQTFNNPPPHTFYPIHCYKDSIYVIAEGKQTMELWKYDLNERSWRICEVTGDLPKARQGSATILFESKIYLLCGQTRIREALFASVDRLNDLYVLDIENMKWKNIHKDNFLPADTPTDLKAEAVGQDIYISSSSSQQFFIYSPATNSLQKMETDFPKGDFMIKSHQNNTTIFRIGFNDGPFIEYQRLGIEDDPIETVKTGDFLSQDSYMEFLWKEKLFADVTFVVQDEEILAHRNILVRCRYFQNMFKSGMKEANESKIHVPAEISAKNFKAILEYIYCEKVVLTYSLAQDLITLADMYFLDALKADCENYLLNNVDTENLLTMLDAAEKADSDKLKGRIVSFLVENVKEVEEEVDVEKIPQEFLMQVVLSLKQNKITL